MPQGFFITFEGIEGSGKSTQLQMLADFLKEKKLPFIVTREPGGTKLGQKIRELLLHSEDLKFSQNTEIFLYAADRTQHINEVILPALKENKIILCDRFIDSTVAYQGYARGLPLDFVESMNNKACDGLKPDLTFLVDCPVEVGLKRVGLRSKEKKIEIDRFEKESLLFHQKVRDGYLSIAKKEPNRFVTLDGTLEKSLLHKEICSLVTAKLGIS